MSQERIYLNGFNGLRTVAAMSVLICHILFSNWGINTYVEWPIAHYGVTLFFVISGFLITYLLLREIDKTGKTDIKKFYLRRIFRIWPIYYLYIIIAVLFYIFANQTKEIFIFQLILYLLMAGNFKEFITEPSISLIGHYWSIGVEEQFYLFWPWIVKKTKRLLTYSILIFSVIFIFKILIWYFYGVNFPLYRVLRHTRFDCMMIGAIGAILYHQNNNIFKKIFSNNYTHIISWIVFFLIGLNIIYIPVVIGHEIVAIVSLGMVMSQIYFSKIFQLENIFFNFIGKISYGIYVIHPIVIHIFSSILKHQNFNYSTKLFLALFSCTSITIILAWLSYKYFESYFLRLKTKYSVIKSGNQIKD